jgi:hypothetical protein
LKHEEALATDTAEWEPYNLIVQSAAKRDTTSFRDYSTRGRSTTMPGTALFVPIPIENMPSVPIAPYRFAPLPVE